MIETLKLAEYSRHEAAVEEEGVEIELDLFTWSINDNKVNETPTIIQRVLCFRLLRIGLLDRLPCLLLPNDTIF